MSYKSKTNWLIACLVIAFILIFAIVGCLIASAVKNVNVICLFKHNYDDNGVCIRCGKDKPTEEQEAVNGNVVFNDVVAHNMRLKFEPVALADNPDTYTLTVNFEPANTDDKRIEWSITWKDEGSLWAIGKTVTDYVTVTPTEDYATTAIVAGIKDFGEQIIITAKSLDNEDATATCTLDYVRRILDVKVNIPDISELSTKFTYDVTYSDYTIAGELNVDKDIYVGNWAIYDQIEGELEGIYSGYGVDYVYAEEVIAHVDLATSTITFNKYCDVVDYKGWTGGYSLDNIMGAFFVYKYDVWEEYPDLYRAAAATTTNDLTFSFDFSIQYDGKTYGTKSANTSAEIDTDALRVHVRDITLSPGSIIF